MLFINSVANLGYVLCSGQSENIIFVCFLRQAARVSQHMTHSDENGQARYNLIFVRTGSKRNSYLEVGKTGILKELILCKV